MKFSKNQLKSIRYSLITIITLSILLTYGTIETEYYLRKDGKFTTGVVMDKFKFTKAETVEYQVGSKKYYLVTSKKNERRLYFNYFL